MNDILLLFVAEHSIGLLGRDKNVGRLKAVHIWSAMRESNPLVFGAMHLDSVRNALKQLYPVHKNGRRRTKLFKIRKDVAYKSLCFRNIRLRPLEHIETKFANAQH
jgi:hypothetical protein